MMLIVIGEFQVINLHYQPYFPHFLGYVHFSETGYAVFSKFVFRSSTSGYHLTTVNSKTLESGITSHYVFQLPLWFSEHL